MGLSLRDVGGRVGVSASMLSQVENGRCRASVAVLYRLVTELGMSLDDLFQPLDAGADGPVSRSEGRDTPRSSGRERRRRRMPPGGPVLSPDERMTIELESGVTWEKLSNAAPAGLEFILVTYRPGSSSGTSGKYSQHEGFECAYIVSGELTFHHTFDTWVLRAGDTVTFDASEPHRLENLGTEDVRAVWLILREVGTVEDAELPLAGVVPARPVRSGATVVRRV